MAALLYVKRHFSCALFSQNLLANIWLLVSLKNFECWQDFGLDQYLDPQQTFVIMDPSSGLCGYRRYVEAVFWEKALWVVLFPQFCPMTAGLSIKKMNRKPIKPVSLFPFLTLPVMKQCFSLRPVPSLHDVASSGCSSPDKCLYGLVWWCSYVCDLHLIDKWIYL